MKNLIMLLAFICSNSLYAANDVQVESEISLLKSIQKEIEVVVRRAKTIRTSISRSPNLEGNVNCEGSEVHPRLQGRCSELKVLRKAYIELRERERKVKGIIQGYSKEIDAPSLQVNTEAIENINVSKDSSFDPFFADKKTPNCTKAVLAGWKCLYTTITTDEGNSYKILLKWNRPNQQSRGSFFTANGGAGMGESREDPPSKAFEDQLSELDQVRTVALEMLDENIANAFGGGYFIHKGGYKSAALVFMAALELAVSENLFQGKFLNYLGGSNGSTVAAYAMSKYNADIYFDRVVFQMGPFLPDLATACDKNSASSFYLNSGGQFQLTQDLINLWVYGDTTKSPCTSGGEDRVSILKGGKNNFPNTHIHVIMGAREVVDGFGPWILASNLEWYNGISAKSKSRLIRPEMSHNNSYEDFRRFLKLGPDDKVDPTLDKCNKGTFSANGRPYEYSCGCGTLNGGILQPDGCFHKASEALFETTPEQCTRGNFLDGNKNTIEFSCGCGAVEGGVQQKDGCFHKLVNNAVVGIPEDKCKKGSFKNQSGTNVEYFCGCGDVPGGVLQKDGCFHKIPKL